MKVLKVSIFLYSSIFLSACDTSLRDVNRCELNESYRVSCTGNSSGNGFLKFVKDNSTGYLYSVKIYDSFVGGERPAIELQGEAQCWEGFVRGKVASGTSLNNSLKVLGGEIVGIFNEPNADRPFGKWSMSMYNAEESKSYRFDGFWEVVE